MTTQFLPDESRICGVVKRDSVAVSPSTRQARVKTLLALLLGVCFWFSVPYHFPLELDADPMQSAAQEAASYQGNLSRQISMPIIFLLTCTALYLLPKRGRLVGRSRLFKVSLLYIAWAVLSVAWSSDRLLSGKRLLVFAVDVFFVVTFAQVTTLIEVAAFGFACTALVALLALVADTALLHAFAPFDPDYRFMGVMTANFQAMNLVMCLLCGLTLLSRFPRQVAWLGPSLVFLSGLLFLTRARIGTILFLLAGSYVLGRQAKERLRPEARALLLVAVFAVVLPLIGFLGARSGGSALSSAFMMGRQDTENTGNLSNRAPLWAELAQYAGSHPILGYGFEAFWSPERVELVSQSQGWVVPHAHNSYLDQALSLGMPGALLYAGMLVGSSCVAWQRYARSRNETNLLPAMLLSWLTLLGLTESIPLSPCLPVLLAYSCIARMCLSEQVKATGSTQKSAASFATRAEVPTPRLEIAGVRQ